MMMEFGFLGIVLVWGALLALVVGGGWLLRQVTGTRLPALKRQPTARQVLDARFARGDIGREEYEAIRAQLER